VFGAKIQWNQILGMLIAFVGITAIAVDMHAQSSFVGFLLILGSAMAWSVSNILYQKAGKVDMFGVTVWSSLVPPLPMLAFSWYFEEVDVPVKLLQSLDWIGVICLLFTSCVSTWIGSTLWGILLKTYDAARVAPFSLLIPIFGLSSSWLFLGEKLSSVTLTASLLVFVGLIINQWRFERRPRLLHQEAVVSNKKDKAA
jgi:O-acetylserine/cysteine efflux transporter